MTNLGTLSDMPKCFGRFFQYIDGLCRKNYFSGGWYLHGLEL